VQGFIPLYMTYWTSLLLLIMDRLLILNLRPLPCMTVNTN